MSDISNTPEIKYDVGAEVKLLDPMSTERLTGAAKMWAGTLAGPVRYVLALPSEHQDRALIFVGGSSGLGKSSLDFADIEAIAGRSDFPPAENE